MPTPEEIPVLPPSPPAEASSSRASFASCPPEEEREHHAPREERIDSPRPDETETEEAETAVEERHVTAQQPTPEPEDHNSAPDTVTPSAPEAAEKGEHIEDAGLEVDPPSTVGSPDAPSDSEARLAQAIFEQPKSSSPEPLYLTFPRERRRVSHISSPSLPKTHP